MENIKIDSKFADQSGEIMIIELGGYVDQSNSFQLQQMFENILQSGCFKVIVDFKDLYYMSSAGWGIFVGEIKRFRENGGDIKLAYMNPEIYDVFQMLEFYHILEDYATVEEAAASFGKESEQLDLAIESDTNKEDKKAGENLNSIEEIDTEEPVDQDDKGTKKRQKKKRESAEVIKFVPTNGQEIGEEQKIFKEFIPHTLKKDVKLAELPLPEKIRRVIAQNPLVTIWEIKKILGHEHFGHTKIGIIKLWGILRELDLNTKLKRYRYYRSC